jgi:predicted PurR-regulated permease PerM
LVYFLLASGDLFLKKMVHVMPRLRDKRAVVAVARGIEQSISAYLFGFTVNNAILGCAVTAALYYLDMPNPALWGALAALLNFIPYAGALITAFILALASMATFDDVSRAMTVTGTFMVMTSLEGTLMQPIILGRRLELNPVAILVSVVIWGWLWGIPGALLAVPLLAFMKTVFDAVEPLSPVGELLGRY